MNNMIDVHVHMGDFERRKELVKKLFDIQQYTLCVSNSPEEYLKLTKDICQNKYLKLALGFHPQYVNQMRFNSFLFMKNINSTKYIGEVGLDFSKNYVEGKLEQKKILEFICDIGAKNNKLLSLHCVQAEVDLFEILVKAEVKHAILHWYSGKVQDAIRFISHGYYFSINNKMVKSSKFNELIELIPKNKILVESDAPYTIKRESEYIASIEFTYNALNKFGISASMIYDNFRILLSEVNNSHCEL